VLYQILILVKYLDITLRKDCPMNIYKELAQAVVDKYPNTFAENYHEHIGNEYPYASKELVDKIFEAALQIEGV